ncbi:MAG: extracellular solute-binding protein [Clostridia bacterium]|nr:extracellular solute-binding protein [Clostridia bacterium]
MVTMLALSGCASQNSDAGGSDDGAKVELVYWSMWNSTEPQAVALEAGIKEFMEKNPDVKVTINWNGREIRKTLQPALDNGQKIDIWDEDLERVTKNWKAYALNLEDYLKKTYDTTDGKRYEDAVMGSLIELARYFSEEDAAYAVPYQPFVFAFMYNKEHFEAANITETPKTWDEFLVACEKLKTAGYVPLTTDDAYIDTLLGYHLARYKGYEWVETLVQDKTNALWDDEAVLKTAENFEYLATQGYLSDTVGSNKWPAGQQDIAAGTVSMYLNGTWLVNEIMGSTGPDFKWGTFSYPTVEGGVDGQNAANYGSQAFQINKNCENPDVAFELLVYLTTGKWDTEIAKQSFGVPVSGTAEWPSQLNEAKSVFENLNQVYPWAAGIQADTDKLPIIAEAFTKLLSGQFTAKEFIEAMK